MRIPCLFELSAFCKSFQSIGTDHLQIGQAWFILRGCRIAQQIIIDEREHAIEHGGTQAS